MIKARAQGHWKGSAGFGDMRSGATLTGKVQRAEVGGSKGRGQMQVVLAKRPGKKKGQDQPREKLRCKDRRALTGGTRQTERRKSAGADAGGTEQASRRAPGQVEGPGLDPRKHRRGRRGASGQGVPFLFEKGRWGHRLSSGGVGRDDDPRLLSRSSPLLS